MVIGIDASRANIRERTGTEWYALTIIKHLVELDRSTTFVLYLDRPPQPELQGLGSNVRYRVLNWRPRLLWSQLRLSWEMLWHSPDMLFVPAHTMPVVHPPATVVTIHDLGFEHWPGLYGQRAIGGSGLIGALLNLAVRLVTFGRYGNSELDYHRWSARFAAKRAAQIITISQFTKRELAAQYQVPIERITVIYHGLDQSDFAPPSNRLVQETQTRLSLRHPYVLFVGRLERKKNITACLHIFAQVRDRLPKLELVLVGKPGLGWPAAKQELERLALDQTVHILGWQPRDVYIPLLAGAQAFLFLSEYEGFGMPLLESFAVRTPVIAARIPALEEIGGQAAVYVDPHATAAAAKTLAQVITDHTLRSQLTAQGFKRLKQFNWTESASQTLAVLRQAARRSSTTVTS